MDPTTISKKISDEEVAKCVTLLRELIENGEQFAALSEAQRVALLAAAGQLSRPSRDDQVKRNKQIRQARREETRQLERSARAHTGIRSARTAQVFSAPERLSLTGSDAVKNLPELSSPRNCYVCKAEFTQLHFFYDQMCPACAQFNYEKRFQTVPLHGQVAVITGSRLKIGYQATLMMLRAGAKVIATTRFPVDSAIRYAKEKDFTDWRDLLHIYGLDLRHTPSVEIFCRMIEEKYGRLDLLINNAAQTVRRPPGFYAHLMAAETQPPEAIPETARFLLKDYAEAKRKLSAYAPSSMQGSIAGESALTITWNAKTPGIGMLAPAELSQIPYAYDQALRSNEVFPAGKLDADLQQVDLRETNSWRLRIGEIETSEMLELQLVNSIAPFVLCNKLVPLMKRENTGKKHIVNVSAMEGKFHRFKKADRHPHTNMAKAALNMLTHTSASGLAKDGIYMNAVDTGWVTDEDPVKLAVHKQEKHDFQPPLDIVDGAARVCDPFFNGIHTGQHWSGKFLKDYFPIDW